MENQVLDIIKNIEGIPTLPSVAMEVMSLTRSPDVSIKEISECIHKDPALAMRVLKMANSSFYRRGAREIDTIHRAILLMGLNEVVNIATSVSVLSILTPKDHEAESMRRKLCNHCIATALIARHMDKKIRMNTQGREFVGGLLHDIGKIIFDEYFHDQFLEAYALSIRKDCPIFEAEREIIGLTHMDVGHYLAERWKLPPYLADIIFHHHEPSNAQFKDITALISIANLLAKAKEVSCGGDNLSFILKDQGAWLLLKKIGHPMDALDIERITFEMEDIGKEVQSYISTVTEELSGGGANG